MINPARVSVFGTWVIALGLVTPLCGLWFSCGCHWPWNGLFMTCNAIVKATPQPHCPWCVYPLAATMSIGISLATGALVACRVHASPSNRVAAILYRSGVGTTAFVGVLFLGGWLSALATAYPSFLGLRLN